MSLACAIQMDPIENINIDGDSTFVLALEAQKRGHALYHYLPTDLSLRHNQLYAKARSLTVQRKRGEHCTLGEPEYLDLAAMDVVLMRQDPPFDMAYITATHLLEHVHPKTLVVNDPAEVRNAPEKLFVTLFSDLMPPTVITNSLEEIVAFRAEHKDIIIKPLFGNGGAGVFHIGPENENLSTVVEMFETINREPIVAQLYLPEIRTGDKRIILVDGEPAGAVNRVPQPGEARANFHAGGAGGKAELTDHEQEICREIGPTLKEKGLIFVGIDVIGDYLTEINVTSPTGIQEINGFDGGNIEAQIWDSIENRHKNTAAYTAAR